MKLFSRLRDQRYCAFCKTPRRVYLKKHVDMTNVVAAMLLSAFVSLSVWGQADPRGLMIFCFLIGVGEILVYMRWRIAVVCKMCGFDPVVYRKSPEKAALRVRQFFEEQVQNPRFQLSKSPLLELHKRQQLQERNRLRSRTSLGGTKAPVVSPRI